MGNHHRPADSICGNSNQTVCNHRGDVEEDGDVVAGCVTFWCCPSEIDPSSKNAYLNRVEESSLLLSLGCQRLAHNQSISPVGLAKRGVEYTRQCRHDGRSCPDPWCNDACRGSYYTPEQLCRLQQRTYGCDQMRWPPGKVPKQLHLQGGSRSNIRHLKARQWPIVVGLFILCLGQLAMVAKPYYDCCHSAARDKRRVLNLFAEWISTKAVVVDYVVFDAGWHFNRTELRLTLDPAKMAATPPESYM